MFLVFYKSLNRMDFVEPAGRVSGMPLHAQNMAMRQTLPDLKWWNMTSQPYMTPRTYAAQETACYLNDSPAGKLDHFSENTLGARRWCQNVGTIR